MKKTISIMTVMVFVLGWGTAFADDLPYMNGKDIGTELYLEAFGMDQTIHCAKDFSSVEPRVAEVTSDDIPAWYQVSMRGHATILAGKRAAGLAGGGVCLEKTVKGDPAWDAFENTISPQRVSDQLLVL